MAQSLNRLNSRQLDGFACILCAAEPSRMTPAGFGPRGQLFQCASRHATPASPLGREARVRLAAAGVTVTDFASRFWADARWHGDRCGCPDDRCAGHHHDPADECGCLAALILDGAR